MWLIHCDVRLRSTRLSGSGDSWWLGHHRSNCLQGHPEGGLYGETDDAGWGAPGAQKSSTVHGSCDYCTEDLRSPGTDNRIAQGDHRPHLMTVSNPPLQPYRNWASNTNSEAPTGWGPAETGSTSNRRRTPGGVGCDDPGWTAIRRSSPRCEDAFSWCFYIGRQGISGCSPGSGWLRPDMFRLLGHFRIGLNAVQRQNCINPDGNMTQACQLSGQTADDAVCI